VKKKDPPSAPGAPGKVKAASVCGGGAANGYRGQANGKKNVFPTGRLWAYLVRTPERGSNEGKKL